MEITEKYRPKKLSEVVGQTTAIRQIERVISSRGLAGSSWWLTGATGTGKTTIARILAEQFAENEYTIHEFVGRDVTVDDIRAYEDRMAFRPMGNGRCLIINEAQDLSDAVVSLLLALVEKVKASKYDMIVFTAMADVLELKNDPMNRWRALVGRCCQPELAEIDSPIFRQEVVEFLEGVAAQEGIKAVDLEKLCEKAGWSIRAALSALDMREREGETEHEEIPPCQNHTFKVPALKIVVPNKMWNDPKCKAHLETTYGSDYDKCFVAESTNECVTIQTGSRVLVKRRGEIVEVNAVRVGPKMFSDSENRWYWVKNVTKILT